MTWGWVNYQDILIWKWTNPLSCIINRLLFCRALSPIVHKQQTYRGSFVSPGSHLYIFTSWIMRQVVVLFFFFFFPFHGPLLRSITATYCIPCAHDRRARRSTVFPILGSPDVTMWIFNLNFSIWIWAVELDWCFLWKILTWNLRSEFEQSNLINLNLFYLKFCKLIIFFFYLNLWALKNIHRNSGFER